LQPLEDFHSYITKAHSTQIKILLSPNGHSPLIDFVSGLIPQDMLLAIGPEGGFSPAEESLAKANGYQILSLGKRVLRTETAGIVAITAVHTAWELRK
jgi:16S rRNA (uracil1498-N3)-methyltransferase